MTPTMKIDQALGILPQQSSRILPLKSSFFTCLISLTLLWWEMVRLLETSAPQNDTMRYHIGLLWLDWISFAIEVRNLPIKMPPWLEECVCYVFQCSDRLSFLTTTLNIHRYIHTFLTQWQTELRKDILKSNLHESVILVALESSVHKSVSLSHLIN